MAVLDGVPDPEIPAVSIVELGIVKGIEVLDGVPTIAITPTYTGCPATEMIENAARRALDNAGLGMVAIARKLAPPWSTEHITKAGHAKLLAYGIAPPRGDGPVQCPRCESYETEEVARFGSTPCKALWRCVACSEPFERFKCH